MSQSDRRDTLLDCTALELPPPATAAPKGGLRVVDADHALTLNRKRSWFGSLRDIVQKGALQAKATVDSLRTSTTKSEQKSDTSDDEVSAASPLCQPRHDDIDSMTNQHYHSLNPNSVTPSTHPQPPQGIAKGHRKRNSVFSVISRPSSELSHRTALETTGPDGQSDGSAEPHKRKTSVANSIVGSIRGIGRRKDGATQRATLGKSISSEKTAEKIPLPSSPIDIPSSAPALDLDLGPASIGFECSTGTERANEALRMADLSNITTGRPSTDPLHTPVEGFATYTGNVRPTSPAHLLSLKPDPVQDALPRSATPMPGTTLPLELDGAASDKQDYLRVFERGVTPTTEKERKELRSMRSLDAMAEACTVAHAHDEVIEDTVSPQAPHGGNPPPIDLPSSGTPLIVPMSARRDLTSTSTLTSCPSDMEEITRQPSQTLVARNTDSTYNWTYDDPFGVSSKSGVGPPSPDRSFGLPFRPKASNTSTRLTDKDYLHTKNGGTEASVSPDSPEQSLEIQLELQRRDTVTQDDRHKDGSNPILEPAEHHAMNESSIFDDDASIIAQQLLAEDTMYPNYDNEDNSTSNRMPSQDGPPTSRFKLSLEPSPSSTSVATPARATSSAHLEDSDHTFHFANWINADATLAAPDEPHTPLQDSTEGQLSLPSPVIGERQTPQISPRSSSTDRTPTMGTRLDFDLQRSDRNVRYSALFDETGGAGGDLSAQENLALAFILNEDHDLDANALAAVDIDNAYLSSPAIPCKEDLRARIESPEGRRALAEESVKTDEPETWGYRFSPFNSPAKHTTELQSHMSEWLKGNSTNNVVDPTSSSTGLTVMDPVGQPSGAGGGHVSEPTQSSVGSPPVRKSDSRVTSTDTLDCSLDLFNPPSVAHAGIGQTTPTKTPLASRYRNPALRASLSPTKNKMPNIDV